MVTLESQNKLPNAPDTMPPIASRHSSGHTPGLPGLDAASASTTTASRNRSMAAASASSVSFIG